MYGFCDDYVDNWLIVVKLGFYLVLYVELGFYFPILLLVQTKLRFFVFCLVVDCLSL